MEEKKTQAKQEKPLEKKVYVPPKVTIYGKLTELTASGVGSKVENQGGQAKRRP